MAIWDEDEKEHWRRFLSYHESADGYGASFASELITRRALEDEQLCQRSRDLRKAEAWQREAQRSVLTLLVIPVLVAAGAYLKDSTWATTAFIVVLNWTAIFAGMGNDELPGLDEMKLE